MDFVEVRPPASKKCMPENWFKNLLGAFDCLEHLWSKKCTKCKRSKGRIDFSKDRKTPDGFCVWCKDCTASHLKGYYIENKAKIKKYQIDHNEEINVARRVKVSKDPLKFKEYSKNYYIGRAADLKAYSRAWARAHRKQINQARRDRYDNNPLYRLACIFRARQRVVLKGLVKGGRTFQLLGCSVEEAKSYIESKFQPGMTWENQGFYGWHVDHIIPLSAFDLEDISQQAICFHYTNLQPLWQEDNFSKSDKTDWKKGG
jgi:hypothetical protein